MTSLSLISSNEVCYQVDSHNGPLTILDHINLSIASGEKLAIVGSSGSGKTTLLGLLAGLDVPTSGDIVIDGHSLVAMNEEGRAALRAEMISFVFQNFQLLPALTALENVALPLEIKGVEQATHQAKALLKEVGLSDRLKHYPNQLSGGEQQRVALARAFAGKAPILFADEPTGNLDQKTGGHIADLLFELNTSFATTLVLVTHDPMIANRCSRQVRIQGGSLVNL